jgi:hypothetical protein
VTGSRDIQNGWILSGQASYMAHTDNSSAVPSLVVSMDERALQECKNNVAFVLHVGLFSFCASGIKPCTCKHRYNLAGGGGGLGDLIYAGVQIERGMRLV